MTGPEHNTDNHDENLLTRIRNAYTVGDTSEPEIKEMHDLMIKTFLNTLAEVALSIASREVKNQ